MEGMIKVMKGSYGFIYFKGGDQIDYQVFFHISDALSLDLRRGDLVSFEIVKSKKVKFQTQGINVRRILPVDPGAQILAGLKDDGGAFAAVAPAKLAPLPTAPVTPAKDGGAE